MKIVVGENEAACEFTAASESGPFIETQSRARSSGSADKPFFWHGG